jgi:hypothetical protein
MPSCLSNRGTLNTIIKSQQNKVRTEMSCIVQQLATQSKYPALSRQEKRVAEYNRMRVTQEQSLQKDTKKAERMGTAIGKLLDQLLKDFTEVKQILNDYRFVNTVGSDSSTDSAANLVGDLSAAIDTREAWQQKLINKLTMVYHMVDAQMLGDYTLLHQPESAYVQTADGSGTGTAMQLKCPSVYRPYFHYYTPSGDCMFIPTQVGGHSGDATDVSSFTTSIHAGSINGNFNGWGDNTHSGPMHIRQKAVLGFKTGGVSPAAEGNKFAPQSHTHFQITNKDLEIRQLWRLIAQDATGEANAWWSFLVANSYDAVTNHGVDNQPGLKSHFETNISLPQTMINALDSEENGEDSVFKTLFEFFDNDINTNPVNADRFNAPAATQSNYTAALKHAPTIMNVEDESDLQFIIRLVVCLTDTIRGCQINNDRELAVIGYVEDVSQKNEAYYQDELTELTAIDENELRQCFSVGKELCSELDALNVQTSCNRGNFFGDPTAVGGFGCR